MRLARPIYESLPLLYAMIGVLGFVTAYADQEGARGVISAAIGLCAEIAALTLFLRRQDARERRREYSGKPLDL